MKKLYKWILIGIIVAAAIAGIVHITCEYVHLAKHAEYGASPSVAFFFRDTVSCRDRFVCCDRIDYRL